MRLKAVKNRYSRYMLHIIISSLLVGLGIGFIFAYIWELLTCRYFQIGHVAKRRGLHFHHSLFGPGAWIVLPWFLSSGKDIIIAGIGLGVIAQHALAERMVFITRE